MVSRRAAELGGRRQIHAGDRQRAQDTRRRAGDGRPRPPPLGRRWPPFAITLRRTRAVDPPGGLTAIGNAGELPRAPQG